MVLIIPRNKLLIIPNSIAVTIMQRKIKNPNLNSPTRSFQYSPRNKEIIFGVNEYLKESLKSSVSLKIRSNRNLYTVKILIIINKIIIAIPMNLTPFYIRLKLSFCNFLITWYPFISLNLLYSRLKLIIYSYSTSNRIRWRNWLSPY